VKDDIDFWGDMCLKNWKFWLVSPLVLVVMIVLGVLEDIHLALGDEYGAELDKIEKLLVKVRGGDKL